MTDCSLDDFLVASFGRKGAKEDILFIPTDPGTAYFDITGLLSFNKDLVNWSGSWISVPKSAQLGTTT